MRRAGLLLVVVGTAVLAGCAAFSSPPCKTPSYVVPPPLPPLTVPPPMSPAPDHSRYTVNPAILPPTMTAPAPGTRREAKPPAGSVAPVPAYPPSPSTSAAASTASSALAPPPVSSSPSTMSSANGAPTSH
ncbi:MAG: hypothetical protein ACYCXG_02275 [Acidiferrobacter sp.]